MQREFLGFGVIGNFANHLEQAGEANDFKDIKSEEGAPKGIFPFYIPEDDSFLGRYCVDNQKIILPNDNMLNVQAEPEIALECDVTYDLEGKIISLLPKFFMAFNDTSVRNDTSAIKISQKKNFSDGSKGYGYKIPVDKFENGGICDNYSLTSFLIFEGKTHQYGDNIKIVNYSYFYKKLIDWTVDKLNTQTDHTVLEDLREIIKRSNQPSKILISIGATSYTSLAETRFLKEGDEVCVIAYDHNKYNNKQMQSFIEQGVTGLKDCSIIRQMVVNG
ncbi:hypothetical protein LS73_004955 [Helicobacter muridarum]|uniref:Valyl-tRNA synthetase n=1 Tax=Helicobacter muridarum TaxID=216 RepID=A0A099TY23_9HELI|nr:DUF5718 family protein [Helicobacter muridarum]TLE00335.1 hypothetical protein LS73_004955 [Helicobacter muridarum]STQ85838.1 valyl-tRNA synthetase [Helicobacter muridarum]